MAGVSQYVQNYSVDPAIRDTTIKRTHDDRGRARVPSSKHIVWDMRELNEGRRRPEVADTTSYLTVWWIRGLKRTGR